MHTIVTTNYRDGLVKLTIFGWGGYLKIEVRFFEEYELSLRFHNFLRGHWTEEFFDEISLIFCS